MVDVSLRDRGAIDHDLHDPLADLSSRHRNDDGRSLLVVDHLRTPGTVGLAVR